MEKLFFSFITPTIRHTMTAIGVLLINNGVLESGQAGSFETIATGILTGGAGLAWSWFKNRKQATEKPALPPFQSNK